MSAIFQAAVAAYLKALASKIDDATEYTHRSAFENLIQSLDKRIVASSDPKRTECGAPDFIIKRGEVPVGKIETKDIDVSLDAIEKDSEKAAPKTREGEQLRRYRTQPNLILTDYLEFRWYVDGQRRLTVRLGNKSGNKLKAAVDGAVELEKLLNAFLAQECPVISSAKELAQRMARITDDIRDSMLRTYAQEGTEDWLHQWLDAFKRILIPDLDEAQFADIFAQTLAYGLFAALIHAPLNKEFSREMAAYNLPKTNPFLRKLFSEIAGVDMPDSIVWAVDDMVELLKHTNKDEVLKDFGKGNAKHDPVIHFYETFLAAYDPKLRDVRGVRYPR